jgi:hypothetical protein
VPPTPAPAYACRLCLLIHGHLLDEHLGGWLRPRAEIVRHLEDTHRISGDENHERLLVPADQLKPMAMRPVLLKTDGTQEPMTSPIRGPRLTREQMAQAIGSERIDFVMLPGDLVCLVVNDDKPGEGLERNALATAFCGGRMVVKGDALLIRYGTDFV